MITHKDRSILIVEDEPVVASIVGRLLKDNKTRVLTAGTLSQALDLVEKEHFDILILDRMLPDGDGIAIFRKLRKSKDLSKLPVLILSGKDHTEDQAEGLDIGADDYMVKPFSPSELRARVEALLRRAEKFAQ